MEFAFGFVLLFLVIRSDAIEARGVVVLIRGRDAVAALGDLLPAPRRAFAELLHPELLELLLERHGGRARLGGVWFGKRLDLARAVGVVPLGRERGHPSSAVRAHHRSLLARAAFARVAFLPLAEGNPRAGVVLRGRFPEHSPAAA